nr:sporulation protein [Candidatus Epulopiscium viviparus]
MGLFSKLFMSLGFGEAKIETIFDDDSVRQGGDLTGIICLRGGSSDIKFDGIFVELFGEYLSGEEDDVVLETAKIGELQLAEDFVLEEDADVELPFSLSLPPNAPITTKDLLSEDDKSNVYMRTSLKVDFADDPEDFDRINVYPSREVETVILALTQASNLRSSKRKLFYITTKLFRNLNLCLEKTLTIKSISTKSNATSSMLMVASKFVWKSINEFATSVLRS